VAVVAVGHAWHGEALHSVSPFSVVAGCLKTRAHNRSVRRCLRGAHPVIISLLVDWNVKEFLRCQPVTGSLVGCVNLYAPNPEKDA
jgi:hypothetical protein